MQENKLERNQEYSNNKKANRAIGVLVAAVVLLLSGLLILVACDDAAKPTAQETDTNTESIGETTLPPVEEEVQEQQQGQEQQQEQGQPGQQQQGQQQPFESSDSPLEGTQFEDLPPTTMADMPQGDDPEAYALWLIALDGQEFFENITSISGGLFGYPITDGTYTKIMSNGATTEEGVHYCKYTILCMRALEQGRVPISGIEREYISAMQLIFFGVASPLPGDAPSSSTS